ncbi:peptidoglycan DD-metalloendopeptidase family protein [Thioalkalivibrio sp. AKL17]|uniref:peptidoglycan DD-metalloendopeptidase family protein n=1 Tax=Thioalkalivibrio sp. AKL17 TaxID=1158160 RepID=UPI000378805C|nr:peptidoglycan DD-metalloendopeptidase family protein [Thioalkalivibrio sp. AKL17]
MNGQRRITSSVIVGTAGLALAVGSGLVLASKPQETEQPLQIAPLSTADSGSPYNGSGSRDTGTRADWSQASVAEPVPAVGGAVPPGDTRTVAFAFEPERDAGEPPSASEPTTGATSYETFDLDDDEPSATAELGHSDWNSHTLDRNERLSGLWEQEWDLPLATLYRLLDDDENADILNRVRPGQEIEWQVDDEGYLTRMRLWTDSASGYEWVREEDGWDFDRHEVENARETSHLIISAEIDGSISAALSRQTELSSRAAAAIAVLMDRHLPVRLNARAGDEFTLLVEQETVVGEDTPQNLRLLAFDYNGERIQEEAARNVNGRFYRPDGESLLPPFDRRPFSGNYRISSGFDPQRRHPVTGRVAPHHGTDFAMPVGTPIQAPADGRVTRVEHDRYAGRFIVIEHGQGYSTRYLHLDRALVSPGDDVERGDRIALSGNTGRSTGPHLHYEVHVKGRPKDPMRVALPESDSLEGEDLEQFREIGEVLFAQLENGQRGEQVALRPFSELAGQ